jgi:hypothetical protein
MAVAIEDGVIFRNSEKWVAEDKWRASLFFAEVLPATHGDGV